VSRPFIISVTDLAAAQLLSAQDWWLDNRPKAPNAVREECERACALISTQPQIGARARNVSLIGVRRLYLSRVRYFVYYRVIPESERIEVLAFWHGSRGRPPQL
jgi:plasmid stabilization system protein ParE